MKKVAIVGGGQLARMLALAGIPMGIKFSFLLKAGEDNACVRPLGDCVYLDEELSAEQLYLRLGSPDVVTIEYEHVDVELLRSLSAFTTISPSVSAIEKLGNRIQEKLLLSSNTNSARYFPFYQKEELLSKADQIGLPIVIKAATGGYDGKGQYRVKTTEELDQLELPQNDGGYIAEAFVEFSQEVSFIAARGKQGDMVFYPATENVHWEAILYTSIAPARNVEEALVRQGQQWLADLMNTLDYVGVMAMECFVANEGGKQVLYVNELSPRVHNSGHWTQAGCDTSQFENHIRAIAGFPLGSTRYEGYTAMVNLLGKVTVDMQGLSDNMSLHWYDKQARERRKMGHINIKATQYEQMSDDILRLTQQLNASDPDFPAHHDS